MLLKGGIIYLNMYNQIISVKNIQRAYFDLAKQFDEDSKSEKYLGIDGLCLGDFDIDSAWALKEIRQELIDLKPLRPALEFIIPKKRGGERKIFVYTIKDRIKAQAIYRILEPFFEKLYNNFLFSYRSSHPSEYAAKSVCKRYKKYFSQDFVFCSDISDYTESIEHNILIKKLKKTGLNEKIIKLLKLFIKNPIISNGKLNYWDKGVIQGVPVITFFANIYLNKMDKYVGKKVELYRRVGDDFIIFDKNLKKVKRMKNYILKTVENLGLHISQSKTNLIKSNKKFSFLGYEFENRKISINQASVKKAFSFWKKKLRYYDMSDQKKIYTLKKILYNYDNCIHDQFVEIISAYKYANDKNQIKKMSEKFFRILTKYFFKHYSHRNQRLTKKLLSDIEIPSLYKYFLDFHHGKKSITEISLSKEKFH